MSDPHLDYWSECISAAAEECELSLTAEQLKYLAEAVQGSHENYGMAFYSPPPSARFNSIEREWKEKLDRLQKDFDKYVEDAETAVKQALRRRPDDRISIGEYGEVRLHDGRSDRIQ